MYQVAARRLVVMVPQLLILSMLMFWLADNMPGDAVSGLAQIPDISAERAARLREIYGLDRPWYVRYVSWLGGVVNGDFGVSIAHQLPVADIVRQRAANSFVLSSVTLVLLYAIAIPLGLMAGRYRLVDKVVSWYTYVAMSMPTVVVAVLALLLFGFVLGWVPVRGSVGLGLAPSSIAYWVSRAHHIALPALTGALMGIVGIVQYLRSEVSEQCNSMFCVMARAKGLSEGKVYKNHVLRNALLPLAADLCWVLVALVSGSIFIENIFSYPGMGQLFIESVEKRDFPVVNFIVVMYGALLVVGSVIADVVITKLDPRIRVR